MKTYRKTLLTKRILAMAAAASLFVAPSITHSQNITKSDSSKANTVKVNGRVTNVTPDKTVNGGKTAINKFAKFELDKGNIANLHLEQADTLVNFVDSKANINGIVNAVKNNRVDGNLYFLSSKGIAVGAAGAINAGKVGLITPNEATYNSLLNSDSLSDDTFSAGGLDNIPLNADGSISIAGSINAPGGITIAAQNVDIKAGAKLLNTNTIDYSSIVNTTDDQGGAVNAGLEGNLSLTKDDNGGIYISARVDNDTISQSTNIMDQVGIDFTRFGAAPLTAEVKVEEGANLTSDADVNIKASLISSHEYDNTSPLTAAYGFKSNLDIAGTIQAKNINLSSTLKEDYTRLSDVNSDEKKSPSGFDITMLANLFSLLNVSNLLQDYGGLANGYLLRSNSAALTIGDKASLNATDIKINADSSITAKLKGTGLSNSDSGAAAFNFGMIANSADLNIKGKITSKGEVDITSKAGANIEESAKIDIKKDKNTAATIAGNFITGASEANLKIADSANIEAGGKLNLASTANTPITLESVVNKEGSGLGALVVNFDKFDSKANLDVDANLKAGGNVTINAEHTSPTFKITSEIATNNPTTDATQSKEEAKKTQEAGGDINKLSGGGDKDTGGGSNIAANASIVMAENGSSLAIKGVEAAGELLVSASNVMTDPQVGAISLVAAEPAGTTISPVITYTNIKNNTNIALEGDLTANKIEINNSLTVDAPRLEQAKKDVLSLKDKLSNAYKGLINKVKNTDSSEALDEANERLDKFLKGLESSDGDAMKALTGSANEILKDLKDYFVSDPDVKDAIDTLERVTDATQVANFYADKETVNTSKKGDPNFSLAATALVNMMDNTAAIKAADGITLNSRSGDLKVDSEFKNVGFRVSGHILPKSLDTSAIDAVVGVNIVNDSNTTTFGKNVNLKGGDISLNADNKINHLVLNDGSGRGANSSYQAAGTVSYAGGGSTAEVNIGAAPNITATNAFKVATNNDTNLFNVAGGLSYGSGAGSVGIGVAVNDFDVNTKAIVGTTDSTGSLNAASANVKATTDGMVNSLSVAGSLALPSSSSSGYMENGYEEAATTSSTSTESLGIPLLDNFSSFLQSDSVKKIAEIAGKVNKVVSTTKKKIDKAQNEDTGAKDKPDTNVPKTSDVTSSESEPKVTFDGAGSASVNLGSRDTQSGFRGVNTSQLESVNVNANDKNFTGAWSGAGALNFRGGNSTSVAIAGAVAVNDINANVLSDISSVNQLTGTINNTAEKNGALVAAGLGLSVSTSSGSNYTGAASASVNLADNVVKSSLNNNAIGSAQQKAESITNQAINNDTQITGGINVAIAAGGSGGAAMGGSGVWSDIDNDINALVEGGSYNTSGTFKNQVGTTLTDIAAGAGVGVSTGGYGIQGVFTYNKVKNNAHANVNDADITASDFLNTAADTTEGLKVYDSMISGAGLDVTGDSYSEFAKVGEVDSTKATIDDKAAGGDGVAENTSKGYRNEDYGNKIITGAIAVAGSSKGAVQASLAISDVDNDFKSEVKGSSLNVDNIAGISATSNTLDVAAAAGAAVAASGFGAGGSVSWQVNDNDVVAGIDGGSGKKELAAKVLDIDTNNKALEVNVAGQVSGGSGVAAGLGLAYNALTDNTNSYLNNGSLGNSSVNLNAESGGKVYAVGAGVAASTSSAALNGVVAINHGSNSTNATISGVKGEKVNSLNVNATDSVDKMAIVGGLTLSGGAVAIGGSVALNDVGALGSQQQTKVSIKDSNLQVNNDLNVNVKDETELLTVGVGVGLTTGSVAVQGAAAVATLNKDVGIDVNNSDLKADSINLNAATSEDLTTTADVLSVSSTAAIGAGVSINNDNTKTGVAVDVGSLTANNVAVNSSNDSKVLTIGIGVAGAGSGAAVTGSVALNNLATDTSNNIKNATVEGKNGVKVVAKGDEAIANYGGNLALTGSGASVGLSVSINNIDSNVGSNVENTTFKNTSNSTKYSVNDTVDDSAIRNTSVDKDTFNSTVSLKDSRKNAEYTGVLIDATATHDIKSALFNVGATGTGAAVNGTVNINRVNGSTAATTKDSVFDVNGNVNVISHDYTNTSGLVGTGSVALTGAGVGIGSDNAVLNRTTTATLDSNGNSDSLKANTVKIDATGKQGVGSLVAGVAFAATGAGLSNGVAVDLMSGNTSATISDAKGSIGTLDISSNQKTNLNTVGVSAGIGGVGAGVGLSVDVINNKANTSTNVKDSNLNVSNTTDVKSNTNTSIDYELYDVGAAAVGGGVAGAIAVANNTATTTTDVSNSTINNTGKANYTSNNSLTFNDKAVAGGIAGLGGGVGVGVTINTIDSSVNTKINGTVKSSGDITISANESRNVDQTAAAIGAGAGAASANVMITNVGKALDDEYSSGLNREDDGSYVSTTEEIDKANDAVSNSKFGGDEITAGGVKLQLVSADKKKITKGGSKNSGTHIKIGGTVEAQNININNSATNDINLDGVSGGAGGVSVNGAVGLVNLERNATSTITGTLNAKNNLKINNTTDGTTELNIYQGSAALALAANVSYADLTTSGVNEIKFNGGTVNAAREISVNTDDTSTSKVNSIGVAVSGTVAIGVLIADSTLESGNTIDFTKSTVNAPTVNITAGGSPSAEVEAIAANGGALGAGTGLFAGTKNATSNTLKTDDATTFNVAGDLNINAVNGSKVSTKTDSITGSIGVSGSITSIKNISNAAASVNVGGIVVGSKKVSAMASSTPVQSVDLVNIGAGGLLAGTGAVADVRSNVQANVEGNYKEINAEEVSLKSRAENSPDIDVSGLTAGAIASGSNIIEASRSINANVGFKPESTSIGKMSIKAETESSPDLYANGDGGGLIEISPAAAVIKDNVSTNAGAKIGGKVNVRDDIEVTAQSSDSGKAKADALGAAVIGGSGVNLERNVSGSAVINIDGAQISTGKGQSYKAVNALGNSADLEAAGYGGLNATAGGLDLKNQYTSEINVKGKSELKSSGSEADISFAAGTEGEASALNNLKAAGAIEVVISESEIENTFKNSVNLDNSSITTTGDRANVIMAAYDRTGQRYQTIANIQGGAAGVAGAEESNVLRRYNSINLKKGTIDADGVSLNAGYDGEDVAGKLTLTTFADVYNKTALPLASMPEMENRLSVNNTVNVDGDSSIKTVRDVKLKAEAGTELLTESAKEYNIYTGESGEGGVIVTTGNEGNPKESRNNYVNIDGNIETGIHNSLVVDLTGEYKIANGKEENNIKATASKGGDFFDVNTINKASNAQMSNPFLKDYNDALAVMRNYAPGSVEYDKLKDQANGIVKVMAAYGFAEKVKDKYGKETGKYITYDQIGGPAIELPNINVAGGNVDITADAVKGSGKIVANAANELTINNKTNKTILINDLVMDNAGGKVYLNDVLKTGSLGGIKLKTSADVTPKVNLNNTGSAYRFEQTKDNPAYTKTPDIIVNGSVRNSAGEVNIKNNTGSVLVNGQIYSLTATKIDTPNGGVIIDNSRGLQNVGSDPMLKWTFGNQKFAEKLQEYVGSHETNSKFKTYNEYLDFVWNICNRYMLNDLAGAGGNTWENKEYWRNVMKAKYAPEEFAKDDTLKDKYIYKAVISLNNGGGTNGKFAEKINDTKGLKLIGYIYTANGKIPDQAIISSDSQLSSLDLTDSITQINNSGQEPSGSIVAGGAVSIIAKTLNVNGLIQSGFNNYQAATSETKFDKVRSGKITKTVKQYCAIYWVDKATEFSIDDYLKEHPDITLDGWASYQDADGRILTRYHLISYKSTPETPTNFESGQTWINTITRDFDLQTTGLNDSDVIGNNDYKVNDTSADTVYNSKTGMYDKVVGLYYNPSTEHLLNDPINVTGGVIYLKATDFISTGNGRIVAAGGGADVNLTNGLNADLYIKDVNTSSRGNPVVMINNVDYSNKSEYKPNSKAVYGWTGAINYNAIETKKAVTYKWLWGAIDGGNTRTLVAQLKNESVGIDTISTSAGNTGKPVDPGVFTDNSGGDYLFGIETKVAKGEKIYGETSTKSYFAKWYDYITSKKTVEYIWTETTPNYANTTYRLNAAQPISIVTSNKQNVNVNITNSKWHDLVIDGGLNLTGNSTINLTTNKAIRTTKDENEKPLGSLTAKNISLKTTPGKGNNVNVVIGTLPKNEAINLKVENWGEGEVNIKSNAPIESLNYGGGSGWTNKTNLTLTAADKVSGSIDTTGNVTIKSEDKINITGGSIGGVVNLTGDAGVKVNVSGDLKIGKIVSDGAVELTAKGAIVNSVDEAVSMTGSAEKLQSWYDAGLISDKDKDNESSNAAAEEKAVRLKGLENLFKRWALNKEGVVDEAYYNKLISHTADTSTFTAEQLNQYDLYQELKESDTYGFSKNDLLYAIQEGLLNPAAGLTAEVSDPIIVGKSVKLNAASIGKDMESVTYKNLNDTETLSMLAGAKLGDVVFNKDGSITMNEQAPVTIDLLDADAKTSITTKGKTYIAGTNRTALNITTEIKVPDDKVVLMTGAGITDKKLLAAKQLELYAGAGDLNISNVKVGTGGLVANALDNIEIAGSGDLTVKNVTAGDTVTIANDGKITPLNSDAKIRSGENINLSTKNKDIATAATPLYLDTINANVNAGTAHAYITGDYRYLTLKDKDNDYKQRKQYYNLITTDGGVYTLNTKKFVNASTSSSHSYAIRALGDLYLGYILGDSVDLRAGKDIIGDVDAENVLQAAQAHLFGRDVKDVKTTTQNVTTRLTGTLELKYTGSNDFNLNSENDLVIKSLDTGKQTANINIKGNFSDLNTEIKSGKTKLTATGNVELNNPTIRSDDSYNGNYLTITTNSDTEGAKHHKNSNLTATYFKKVDAPNNWYFQVSKGPDDPINLNTDKHITLDTPSVAGFDVYADRDIDITVQKAMLLGVSNTDHITNIDAGDNLLWLGTSDDNNLRGTINGKLLAITSDGDLDITTDSKIDMLSGDNVNIKTTKLTVDSLVGALKENINELKNIVGFRETMTIDTPTELFFGSKLSNPAYNVNTGDKEVTILADKNFTLKTDNLNLKSAKVGNLFTATSGKDIKGKVNAYQSNLTAGGDIDLKTIKGNSLDKYKGENITLINDSADVSIDTIRKGTFDNGDTVRLEAVDGAYYGAKKSSPNIKVNLGERPVTINAVKDFTLTTDNLKLNTATVGKTLKVTADKDISGTVRAGEIDLTAKENVKVQTTKSLTGKVNAGEVDLKAGEQVKVTSDQNITGKVVSKQNNLSTKNDINLKDSSISAEDNLKAENIGFTTDDENITVDTVKKATLDYENSLMINTPQSVYFDSKKDSPNYKIKTGDKPVTITAAKDFTLTTDNLNIETATVGRNLTVTSDKDITSTSATGSYSVGGENKLNAGGTINITNARGDIKGDFAADKLALAAENSIKIANASKIKTIESLTAKNVDLKATGNAVLVEGNITETFNFDGKTLTADKLTAKNADIKATDAKVTEGAIDETFTFDGKTLTADKLTAKNADIKADDAKVTEGAIDEAFTFNGGNLNSDKLTAKSADIKGGDTTLGEGTIEEKFNFDGTKLTADKLKAKRADIKADDAKVTEGAIDETFTFNGGNLNSDKLTAKNADIKADDAKVTEGAIEEKFNFDGTKLTADKLKAKNADIKADDAKVTEGAIDETFTFDGKTLTADKLKAKSADIKGGDTTLGEGTIEEKFNFDGTKLTATKLTAKNADIKADDAKVTEGAINEAFTFNGGNLNSDKLKAKNADIKATDAKLTEGAIDETFTFDGKTLTADKLSAKSADIKGGDTTLGEGTIEEKFNFDGDNLTVDKFKAASVDLKATGSVTLSSVSGDLNLDSVAIDKDFTAASDKDILSKGSYSVIGDSNLTAGGLINIPSATGSVRGSINAAELNVKADENIRLYDTSEVDKITDLTADKSIRIDDVAKIKTIESLTAPVVDIYNGKVVKAYNDVTHSPIFSVYNEKTEPDSTEAYLYRAEDATYAAYANPKYHIDADKNFTLTGESAKVGEGNITEKFTFNGGALTADRLTIKNVDLAATGDVTIDKLRMMGDFYYIDAKSKSSESSNSRYLANHPELEAVSTNKDGNTTYFTIRSESPISSFNYNTITQYKDNPITAERWQIFPKAGTITNDGTVAANVKGSLTIKSDGLVSFGDVNVEGDLTVEAKNIAAGSAYSYSVAGNSNLTARDVATIADAVGKFNAKDTVNIANAVGDFKGDITADELTITGDKSITIDDVSKIKTVKSLTAPKVDIYNAKSVKAYNNATHSPILSVYNEESEAASTEAYLYRAEDADYEAAAKPKYHIDADKNFTLTGDSAKVGEGNIKQKFTFNGGAFTAGSLTANLININATEDVTLTTNSTVENIKAKNIVLNTGSILDKYRSVLNPTESSIIENAAAIAIDAKVDKTFNLKTGNKNVDITADDSLTLNTNNLKLVGVNVAKDLIITSDKDITSTSAGDSYSVGGDNNLTAAGNINITNAKGDLKGNFTTNKLTLAGDKSISIADITKAKTITSLTAPEVNIYNANNVKAYKNALRATIGNIYNEDTPSTSTEAYLYRADDATVTANAVIKYYIDAIKNFTLKGDSANVAEGNITNKFTFDGGTLTAGSLTAKNVDLKATDSAKVEKGNITETFTFDGGTITVDNLTAKNVDLNATDSAEVGKGNISEKFAFDGGTLTADNLTAKSVDLKATGNVTITASSLNLDTVAIDKDLNATVTKDITSTSATGSYSVSGSSNLTAGGAVNIANAVGDFNGDITANKLTLNAEKSINIEDPSKIKTVESLTAPEINLYNLSDISAYSSALHATTTAAYNKGTADSTEAHIYSNDDATYAVKSPAVKYYINADKNFTLTGDSAKVGEGNISDKFSFNGGSLTADSLSARSFDLKASGDVTIDNLAMMGNFYYIDAKSKSSESSNNKYLANHPELEEVSRNKDKKTNTLYFTIRSESPISSFNYNTITQYKDNPITAERWQIFPKAGTIINDGTFTADVKGNLNVKSKGLVALADVNVEGDLTIEAKNITPTAKDTLIHGDNVSLTATNMIGKSNLPLNIEYVTNVTLNAKTKYTSPTQVTKSAAVSAFAESDEFKQVAKALSDSAILTGKTGEDYNAAAKAWLSGMGYSELEELEIIDLAKAMDFNNLTGRSLFNAAIADVAAKYSGENIDTSSLAC